VSSFLPTLIGSLVGVGLGVGIVALSVHARVLPFDRRNRLGNGRVDLPLGSGNCAVARPIPVAVDLDGARWLVATALDRVGAKDVVVLDAWTVAGWTGFTWRSFGQQVGISIQPNGPDQVVLWCCSRPRLASTVVDLGASARSVAQVISVLDQIVPAARLTYP
jgi:hypothetical protein